MVREIASNPFTPKSGWEPGVFIGREKEVEFFRKKLVEAKKGRCDHFLVLGEWGIGKTTLLKEFKKIAQKENFLASIVTVSEYKDTNTFRDGVKELIEQIPRRLPIEISRLKKLTKHLNTLGIQVMGAGFNFSRTIERMQPQTLLLDTLLTLWDDLKNKSDAVVILLDDVQNFSSISGIFTILKNVLSDEEIVEGTKFLVVLSCTPDAWKQFLIRHHPIGRYFTPRLKLERLGQNETLEVLNALLKDTRVIFDEGIKRRVYEYTEGHPYEMQVLCSNLYDNQIGGRVTTDVWDISLNAALNELGEMVFDTLYQRASKNERKVLYVATKCDLSFEKKDVMSLSQRSNIDLPENTIKTSLSRLCSKGLLIRPDRFKYSLPDRIFKEYIIGLRGYNGEGEIP